jgi:hypothetical protein
MISLADLANGPSGWGGFSGGTGSQPHRRGRLHWTDEWPQAGDLAATYRDF